ncbi:MAG: SWIM zinc finger family protein [Anaerolineae bacterium]|nr:SWIM zinc finger family protein [Anaerolineae bacterium]
MVVPTNIKDLQNKSRDLRARRVDNLTYVVESTTNPTAHHVVTVRFNREERQIEAQCTCAWAEHRGIACSHVLAALEYMASLKDRTLSFWIEEDAARRQKHRLFHLSGKNTKDGIWITSRSA